MTPSGLNSARTPQQLAHQLQPFIVPVTLALAFFFLFVYRQPLFLLSSVLALVVARWIAFGTPFPQTSVNVLILVLWVGVGIGLVITPAAVRGVEITAIVITGSVLVFELYETTRKEPLIWTSTAALVLVATGVALAVPFIVVNPPEKFFDYPEWYATLPKLAQINPNQLAGPLEAAIPLALGLVIGSSRWRPVGLVCLPILVIGLQLLQSRGAFVGLAIGLLVYGALYRSWFIPLCLSLIIALLVVNVALDNPIPVDEIYQRSQATARGNLTSRYELWQQTSKWLVEKPLGLGVGAYPLYRDALLSDVTDDTLRPHTHQLFLQVGLDTGFIGLAAFVSLITMVIVGLARAYYRRSERHLYIAFLATWLVMLIHGMVDTVYWGNRASLILWVVVGLSLSAARYGIGKRKRKRRASTQIRERAEIVEREMQTPIEK